MENQKEKKEDILAGWEFPELPEYQRGKLWYAIAAVFFILFIVYSFAADNLLFALVLVLFIFVVLLANRRRHNVKFTITPDGIIIGNKSYLYRDIEKFWIIYQPPDVKKLFFSLKGALRLNLVVQLEKQNPVEIRKILLKYLLEDLSQEDEPLSDKISRAIKL